MKVLILALLAISSASALYIRVIQPSCANNGGIFLRDGTFCTCNEDGITADCTDFADDSNDSYDVTSYRPNHIDAIDEMHKVCEPNIPFKVYCNTCGCASNGMWFSCTRMNCDRAIWNEDGTLKSESTSVRTKRSVASQEKLCEPGTQFKDYCNTCGCADDGLSYICTRRMCDESIWNKDGSLKIKVPKPIVKRSTDQKICEPNSQFKNYCNTCFCNDDGTSYACTRMMCPADIWNQDGSLKIQDVHIEDGSAPKKVCEPNSSFNDYCNTCKCSNDGTIYGCTLMLCDENLWYKNGTRKIVEYQTID